MGEVIYLKRFCAERSTEAVEFELAFVPTHPAVTAGSPLLHEYGLPRIGLPHHAFRDLKNDHEN